MVRESEVLLADLDVYRYMRACYTSSNLTFIDIGYIAAGKVLECLFLLLLIFVVISRVIVSSTATMFPLSHPSQALRLLHWYHTCLLVALQLQVENSFAEVFSLRLMHPRLLPSDMCCLLPVCE